MIRHATTLETVFVEGIPEAAVPAYEAALESVCGTVGFFRSLREKSPTPEAVQMHENAIRFGFSLVILGIAATVLAGLSHWFTLRRLRRNETPVLTQWPLSITVCMLLAVIGLVALWHLIPQ